VLWFSSSWSGVELRVMCPVCRMLQHPARSYSRRYKQRRTSEANPVEYLGQDLLHVCDFYLYLPDEELLEF